MSTESATLSLLSIVSLISFFVFLLTKNLSKKFLNGSLLDIDFNKPQSFHNEPIARAGGLAGIISLLFFVIMYYLLFKNILNDYLFIPLVLFLLGFADDIKIRINPNTRLVLMLAVLLLSIIFLSVNIDNIDVPILREWMKNRVFETLFILLCFLFIINGANLIDGFNGLLTIHLIIINFLLLMININNQQTELSLILTAQIVILFSFLLFNFPKAQIFLGDSGSYLFGGLITLNIIETNNLNPDISSFFFCTLLFYLFFEVFFSFFRKLLQKKSPLIPDKNHLHMLIYSKFTRKNYLTSLVINSTYLFLILPGFFFMENPFISRIWFFSLILFYLIVYYLISKEVRN